MSLSERKAIYTEKGTFRALSETEIKRLFSVYLKQDPKTGKWKGNVSRAATELGVSRPSIYKAVADFGARERVKKIHKPEFVDKYEQTRCHQKIIAVYTDPRTKKLSNWGQAVDARGLTLYLKFKQTDPLDLQPEDFILSIQDPDIVDPQTGKPVYQKVSATRNIMEMAGFSVKTYKELTTKGIKREPQKKEAFLEDPELIKYIYGCQEIDTLVYSRLGFESGGRCSSLVLTTTDKIVYSHNAITMYEPKVKQLEERYFRPSTMEFLKTYIHDYGIVGKLFRWGDTRATAWTEAEKRILRAGLNAGLWRYTGKIIEKKTLRGGRSFLRKVREKEGKVTSTHVLKHTFVSLASLHGFGLDDVSEQTGTDPSTLKKYYFGVGKRKLKALILGEFEYLPWDKWIDTVLSPHWEKRYNELKAAGAKIP